MPAPTWNPASRFALTRAIVERHTFSIDAYAASTGDRALVEGRWHTDKAPIPSMLAVPAYATLHALNRARDKAPEFTAISTFDTPAERLIVNGVFKRSLYVCSLSTVGVGAVVLGLLLLELARRRVRAPAAFAASATAMLATPLLPYATSFYGHVLAGTFVVAAITALDSALGEPTPRRWRIAGACLSLAPGCEYIVAFPAALIGAWALWRAPDRPRALRYLAEGAVLPILLVGFYHHVCFGAPYKTGYSYIVRPEFAAGHAKGFLGLHLPDFDALLGLLVGDRRGLFYISPVSLLGAAGLAALALRRRGSDALSAAVFALLLLLNAGYYMWWGGAAAGPRHLVPVVGLLALGIGFGWQASWGRPMTMLFGAVSFANCLALTAVGLEASEFSDILIEYAWPRLLRGQISPVAGSSNLSVELGIPRPLSLVPLLGWLLGGGAYLALQLRRMGAERAGP